MEKRRFEKVRADSADTVYGIRAVMETIEAGHTIDRVLMSRDGGQGLTQVVSAARKAGVPLVRVPDAKLDSVTRGNHQGVIAFISPIPFCKVEDLVQEAYDRGEDPLIVALDGVTDVRNLGAIARTAECAGATGLLLPETGSARLGADAMKTSAGALNYLPVARSSNLEGALKFLKNSGLTLICATEEGSQSLFEVPLSGPTVLVMGSEDEGISPNILRHADYKVAIPMRGRIESLNVGIATAVILFEIIRQRNL